MQPQLHQPRDDAQSNLTVGYALRERIDNEYWQSRRAGPFLDRRDEFTARWGEEAGEWAAETRAVLLQIGGPTAKGRFQNARTPIGMVSGDVKWNNIRNFLRTRLAALELICKTPSHHLRRFSRPCCKAGFILFHAPSQPKEGARV